MHGDVRMLLPNCRLDEVDALFNGPIGRVDLLRITSKLSEAFRSSSGVGSRTSTLMLARPTSLS